VSLAEESGIKVSYKGSPGGNENPWGIRTTLQCLMSKICGTFRYKVPLFGEVMRKKKEISKKSKY